MAYADTETKQEASRPDAATVCAYVAGCYEDWKLARQDKEKAWQECIQNYLVYVDETKYAGWPWRSKVADTFSQETGDTIKSAMRNALFPVSEEYYEIEGLDLLGKVHATNMHAYMDQCLHRSRFMEKLSPGFGQLSVIGNAPILATWKEDSYTRKRRVRRINTATGQPSVSVETDSKVRYRGPCIEVLDAFDVVFDPTVARISDSPIIRRVKLPKVVVEAMYGVSITEAKGTPKESSDVHKVDRARIFGLNDQPDNPSKHDPEEVELIELYGSCILDGEKYDDWHIVIANRSQELLFEACEYWGGNPIFWGTYDLPWFSPYGKGPLEPVRGTQALIDTFTNQKADILNLIIMGSFKYVDDGIIDPDNMYLRPGGGIEVGTLENMVPLSPNQNVALTYTEIEYLRSRGERSTGASKMDMGQAPGGRRTAYEANIVRQGSASRLVDVSKHLANEWLEPMLEFHLACIQQYGYGQKDMPLPEDALLGEYRLNYLGADMTAMRQFELQQMMGFLDMAGRNPQMSLALNPPELMTELMRLFRVRNKKIVKTPEEYAAAQAQQQEQAIQMEALAQQGAPGQMGAPIPEAPVEEVA